MPDARSLMIRRRRAIADVHLVYRLPTRSSERLMKEAGRKVRWLDALAADERRGCTTTGFCTVEGVSSCLMKFKGTTTNDQRWFCELLWRRSRKNLLPADLP